MRFPQTFIDDLRRQADIVRVISGYVPLKKKGANWMACCPFHQEKTPSFSVSPAKDIFFCFSCQKGGSVFNFVMEMERVAFPEAIRIVAEKAGVPLPQMERDNQQQQRWEAERREADAVIKLNERALEWWEAQLAGDTAEARQAREYVQGRGISEETRRVFRLGYAPNSWDGLLSLLQKSGATHAEIERSGLVVKKDTGGSYDRFRGRIIFPVIDVRGRPIAFGARTLQPDGEPKYLNSPETIAYTKGRHLYGLNIAREEIRRRRFVILVEGYLDLIILYQHGIRNAVASLGTALTGEQVKLLTRFARKIVVNYDGDKAGVQAAKRAIESLLTEDFEVKVLVLPDNADPDEFIKARGVEEYHKRRGAAPSFIQFVLEQATRNRDIHRHAEDKKNARDEVRPFIIAIKNTVLQREYFDMAMDLLRVPHEIREEEWREIRAASANRGRAEAQQKAVQVVPEKPPEPTVAERRLLELLVHDRELQQTILPQIEPSDYKDLPTAAIFQAFQKLNNDGAKADLEALCAETVNDAVAENLLPLLFISEPERAEGEASDEAIAEAYNCLSALRSLRANRRWKELDADIHAAQRTGNDEQLNRLVIERMELEKLMKRWESERRGGFVRIAST